MARRGNARLANFRKKQRRAKQRAKTRPVRRKPKGRSAKGRRRIAKQKQFRRQAQAQRSRKAITRTVTTRKAPTRNKVSRPITVSNIRRVSTRRRGTSRTINGLSPRTIKRQQQLSNRFGVTTFNRRGGLSTLPTLQSGGFSDINVGIGRFSDLNKFSEAAIQKQVGIETNIRQATGSGVTIDDFGSLIPTASADSPIFVSDPREPQRFFNQETGSFDSGSGFESLIDKAPIAIAAFIGIILVLRLIKKI